MPIILTATIEASGTPNRYFNSSFLPLREYELLSKEIMLIECQAIRPVSIKYLLVTKYDGVSKSFILNYVPLAFRNFLSVKQSSSVLLSSLHTSSMARHIVFVEQTSLR